MFRFVVRHLRGLARVPGLPQVFDAFLVVRLALFDRERLVAIEAVETAASLTPGMHLRAHRFGGVEFCKRGREIGHLHGNGLLDLFTGRDLARTLTGEGRAEPHHLFGESAWVSFWITSPTDVGAAMDLIRKAEAAADG